MYLQVRATGVVYGISNIGDQIVLGIGLPVIAYCLFALIWILNRDHLRGALLAMIGLIASILWTIGFITLFQYIEATLT